MNDNLSTGPRPYHVASAQKPTRPVNETAKTRFANYQEANRASEPIKETAKLLELNPGG